MESSSLPMRIQGPIDVSSGMSREPTRSKPAVKSPVSCGVQLLLHVMRD